MHQEVAMEPGDRTLSEPNDAIHRLFRAMVDVNERLMLSDLRITAALETATRDRHLKIHALADEWLPDLSLDTLVRLISGELREFGAQVHVQEQINGAIALEPGPIESLFSFVYESESVQKHARHVHRHKPNLHRELAEFLDLHKARLDCTAKIREIDIDIDTLREYQDGLIAFRTMFSEKSRTLAVLNGIIQTHASDQWEFDPEVTKRLNIMNASFELSKTAIRRDYAPDPLLSWLHMLPGTLAEWGIDPVRKHT